MHMNCGNLSAKESESIWNRKGVPEIGFERKRKKAQDMDNQTDFEQIYKQSVLKVYYFLLRLSGDENLAEELTEETFYQAFLHIDRFKGECEIDTWLCQIAKNAFYKEEKRKRRHLYLDQFPEKEMESDSSSDLLKQLERKEQSFLLHKHLHNLTEPYKEVFTLKVFGELKFKEIASIFGKSESWAKMTYYRAKEKLVYLINEEGSKWG